MILLIGNGPSGDTPAVAAAMARASRVLRMNNWQPGVHTGTRCDIWGTSFNIDVLDAIKRNRSETWWTGWPYGHRNADYSYGRVLELQSNHYDRVASKEMIDRAYVGTIKWVSTGAILAMMASEFGPIAIAGFDHFDGEGHHYWDSQPEWNPLDNHDPEHERRIMAELGACVI